MITSRNWLSPIPLCFQAFAPKLYRKAGSLSHLEQSRSRKKGCRKHRCRHGLTVSRTALVSLLTTHGAQAPHWHRNRRCHAVIGVGTRGYTGRRHRSFFCSHETTTATTIIVAAAAALLITSGSPRGEPTDLRRAPWNLLLGISFEPCALNLELHVNPIRSWPEIR